MNVSGVLNGNKLILSGESSEIKSFNRKLELFNELLNMGNCDITYVKDILAKEMNSKLAVEEFKSQMLEKQLKNLTIRKQELEDILIHNNTITSKGIEGELFVEEYIRDKIRLNENWCISNISKDGNHNSDLELVYKTLKCVIEVKNIKAKLSDSNVRKFKEVYINSLEKEYNSGIFVSLLSDYGASTNIYDFCIQSINGKNVIFLSRVKENPEKLIFAMEILNQLNKLKCGTDNRIFMEMLNKQIKNYSNLYSEVNKSLAAIKDMKKCIKEYQTEIIQFIEEFNSVNA